MFLVVTVAHAATEHSPIVLTSQQFITAEAQPVTLQDALEGDLSVEMFSYSEWDWTESAVEVRLNPTSQPFRIVEGRVEVSPDYPADLKLPQVALEERTLRLTIPRINVLLHPSFEISARFVNPHGEPLTTWTSFMNPLEPLVSVNTPLDLSTALAQPPVTSGKASLDLWLDALLQETLLQTGTSGSASIRISYKNGLVEIPLIATPAVSYSPDLALRLSEAVSSALEMTPHDSQSESLRVEMIFKSAKMTDLELSLELVSGLQHI